MRDGASGWTGKGSLRFGAVGAVDSFDGKNRARGWNVPWSAPGVKTAPGGIGMRCGPDWLLELPVSHPVLGPGLRLEPV